MPAISRRVARCSNTRRATTCANITSIKASVRTFALVEVLFAQGVSRYALGQRTTKREAVGIVLIVVGVVLLLRAGATGRPA